MRIRRLAIPAAAVAAAAAVAVVVGSAVAGASGPAESPDGVLAARQDAGPAADRADVRHAAVGALTDEAAAFAVDAGLRDAPPAVVLRTVLAEPSTDARTHLLSRARSPRLAEELERAYRTYVRTEFDGTAHGDGVLRDWLDFDVWAVGAFRVERWEGVQVTGDTARVLVRGEDRGTSWGGDPKRTLWVQHDLTLERDRTAPSGWRLVHESSASTAA